MPPRGLVVLPILWPLPNDGTDGKHIFIRDCPRATDSRKRVSPAAPSTRSTQCGAFRSNAYDGSAAVQNWAQSLDALTSDEILAHNAVSVRADTLGCSGSALAPTARAHLVQDSAASARASVVVDNVGAIIPSLRSRAGVYTARGSLRDGAAHPGEVLGWQCL
jgi:hypothetical protein